MDLTQVLRNIPEPNDKQLLAGIGEDAIGYRWQNETMVQTVDMITPVVDDPYQFGAIACANALSDIYAKGADPLFALNIIGFPATTLPIHYLEEMIRGGVDKVLEAGAYIAGGHTIDDTSPKYGLSVTGKIPAGNSFIRKDGAKVGDAIILTKPLGIGIYTTAIDQKLATKEQAEVVINQMLKLNKNASLAMRQVETHACTDVTGFGLIGHVCDVAENSNVTVELDLQHTPYLPDSFFLLKEGATSEGMDNNLFSYRSRVRNMVEISTEEEQLLYDPQTSGGLLIFIAAPQVDELLKELSNQGENGYVIGKVLEKNEVPIITKNSFY
ncbi:selenide, water dikinase SelD [Aquibacillus halophilus]|uniref:Selenide, water dikinase SelD n=1 Tax=Aquibacillus halophilus TaxID=930132 RepID=A0A6A8D7B3_9BACI|nr:selenide, water dikinase SelD [Aquibacillus halophilus]MRH41643.1 selenide, water dikinase SelD [Aquibacillus halophilus]